VINYFNEHGGFGCRKLIPTFYQANPVDGSSLQSLCLNVQQSHPFFIFEGGAYGYVYPSLLSCYASAGIPWLSNTFGTAQELQEWYPYAFFQGEKDQVYENTIFALAQRGFFSSSQGFQKLGFAYQDCDGAIPTEMLGWLHEAGVSSPKISTYDLGCSSLFSPPNSLEQAILQFKTQGVTNVIFGNDGNDWAEFSQIAYQQDFNPKYGISDEEAQVSVTYSDNAPNPKNIVGAVDIDNTAVGEEHTPGMAPSAETAQCLAIFGMKVTYPVQQSNAEVPWSAQTGDCGELMIFRAMVDHAPTLKRSELAIGLESAGTLQLPYGYAPANFVGAGVTWGAQYWRVNEYFTDCQCWRLIQTQFRPDLTGP
jgi:hypothetical protein